MVSDLTPLPLSKVTDESIPLKENPIKVLPPRVTITQEESMGGDAKFLLKAENQISTPKSVATVSESPKPTISEQSNLGNETFSAPALEPLERNQLLTQLSQLTNEPLESLRLNTNLVSALDRYPRNIKEALQYFKQAIATWSKRPGIGSFISAVNRGQKLSSNQPRSEWGNWANEAERRHLLLYSQLYNEDILIKFKNGVELLWSEIKSLSWPELEALVLDER